MTYGRPEPIRPDHDLKDFHSGQQTLDMWLSARAVENERSGASRTFVTTSEEKVVGFYTLAVTSIARAEATGRVRRNMPEPIPAMLLARLAVDQAHQGRGLGKHLLRDALLRTLQAADLAGIRAMLVHAADDRARTFYARYGFEPSPSDELHLMQLLDDIAASLT